MNKNQNQSQTDGYASLHQPPTDSYAMIGETDDDRPTRQKYYIGDKWQDFPEHKYTGIEGDKLLEQDRPQVRAPQFSLNTDRPVPDTSERAKRTGDPFWMDQPRILFRQDRLTEFYPECSLSVDEQLNAITRFAIYFSLLLFVVSGNLSSLFLGLVGVATVVFIQQHGRQFIEQRREGFIETYRRNYHIPDDVPLKIDSRGEVRQAPNSDNPFGNIQISDYVRNPGRAPAGDLSDPAVKEQVEQIFRENLFLDINDIWEKNNQQREFYSQPDSRIPNDRESFAKWCFDTRNHSCRENYICKNDLKFDQTGPLPSAIFKNM